MNMEKVAYWVSVVSIACFGLLALGGLALSYNALFDIAYNNGMPYWAAFVWPLLVDLALIVFSVAVFRAYLLREPAHWPWALVGIFTFWTIVFNIIHAEDGLSELHLWFVSIDLRYLVAAVPPVALVLSFETLMNMLRKHIERQGLVQSLSELVDQTDQKRQELDRIIVDKQVELDNLIAEKQRTLDSKRAEIETVTGQIRQVRTEYEDIARQIEAKRQELKDIGIQPIILVGDNDPASFGPMDRQRYLPELIKNRIEQDRLLTLFGISAKTLDRDIKALEEAGVIHRNGNGVEVAQ